MVIIVHLVPFAKIYNSLVRLVHLIYGSLVPLMIIV